MKARCVVCGREFEKLRAAKTCGKECSDEREREYRRKRRAANPEKQREYQRKWKRSGFAPL